MRREAVTPLGPGFLLFVLLVLVAGGCGDDDSLDASSASDVALQILVTNDDGVAAEGIDAIVQALISDPRNDVTVCAPNGNRSGSSDMTGPSARCGDLTVTPAATLSGYAATAIDGCPSDAVHYALGALYPPGAPPHVVISGINAGQNVSGPVATRVSGTVGAARTAAPSSACPCRRALSEPSTHKTAPRRSRIRKTTSRPF
jgi:5'-nucleotidase